MPKVFIVGGCMTTERMFTSEGWDVVDSIEDADLVQFTGGSDVSPYMYGQQTHPKTSYSSARDEYEIVVAMTCHELCIPMAGICRGGQFLHVYSGGSLFQHIQGHAIGGTHEAVTPDGEVVNVTSTHHQAMRYDGLGEVLLTAESHGLCEYMDDYDVMGVEVEKSLESIYHSDTNAFCFQPHPEFSNGMGCRGFYFRKLFDLFGLGS